MIELSPELRRHLPADSDTAFDQLLRTEGTVHRELANRRTVEFHLGGGHYFIKIHQGCGWGEIFKELTQGRLPTLGATREWLALRLLKKIGQPTMEIVGYGRRGKNPARQQSFLITKALEGMVSLEDLAKDWGGTMDKDALGLKRAMIEKVALTARAVHGCGMNHRDFYLCHFLVRNRDWSKWNREEDTTLHLIDLHRAQIRKQVPRRWLAKDLGGLYFSALDCGLSNTDIARFLREYLGRDWKREVRAHGRLWKEVLERAVTGYRKFHEKPPRLPRFPASFGGNDRGPSA